MPILSWSDIVEITHDEAKQSCLDYLSAVGFAASSWQEGSVPLAMVELTAEVWSQLSNVAVFMKTMAMNDTSSGDALTQYSSSQYDNVRNQATSARRRTALSCAATSGPYTFNVGDLVLEHADGPTYRNVDDGVTVYPVTLPSGGSLTGLIFEAEVAGSAANKNEQTVTKLVTTRAGVTVSSDLIERVGLDAETDPRLQVRNKTKWSLLTRFELIRDAVIQLALSAADGITVVAVDDQNPRGAGTFDVYIAGDTSTAGVDDVAAAQALIDRFVMGSGAPEPRDKVIAATEQPLDVTATIYFQGSFSQIDLETATVNALLELIKAIPLGGFDFAPGPSHVVPFNDLTDVLREVKVAGQSVKKTVVMTSPSSDTGVASFSKVVLGTTNLTFVQTSN
jgi:hypothetical protein